MKKKPLKSGKDKAYPMPIILPSKPGVKKPIVKTTIKKKVI